MVLGLFKSSKQKKEDLKVKSLKKTASTTVRGRSANKKKSDARRELNKMGHLTDKQAAAKDKKDRIAYDREHKIVNRRGRQTGTKEGYDPSKGVQTKTSYKSSASTEKAAWLKKTSNSPAAKAGISDAKRWAAYQRNKKKK